MVKVNFWSNRNFYNQSAPEAQHLFRSVTIGKHKQNTSISPIRIFI